MGPLNPSAMTPEEAAAVLGVAPERVCADLEAGLPTVAGGRVHLVEYVAWMCLRLAALTKDAPRGQA